MILESPFLHETHPVGYAPVDDQVGIVDGAQIMFKQRIFLPDLAEQVPVGDHFSNCGNPDLIVIRVQITEFYPVVEGNFTGFMIKSKVADENFETPGEQG